LLQRRGAGLCARIADMSSTVFRARRVITSSGERAAAVVVRAGLVSAVQDYHAGLPVDVATVHEIPDDHALLPGLVDVHVHVNEPGRTEWEGFATATRAAAAGGVTTIVDMPLNSIPATVDVAALQAKRASTAGKLSVDVAFWGGAVPGNAGELAALHEAGVVGFKCFLLDSGVEEFPPLDAAELRAAMYAIAEFDGLLIAHAEDAGVIADQPTPRGRSYRDFLRSRPAQAETNAISTLLAECRRTGCRVHIVHLSSADALPLIARAKAGGLPVTVETCPHYLTFDAETIADGATQFKCCPPIRESANRDRLWAGLVAGTIDLIASDHSPCTTEAKRLDTGDFGTAWGGIASLQLGLSAVWTQARERGAALASVCHWMSTAPALLTGLADRGAIDVGSQADLVVFAPEETFVVDPARLHHRNPVTPYAGLTLSGVVHQTYLRGELITGAPGRMITPARVGGPGGESA
jgi:allantoinase